MGATHGAALTADFRQYYALSYVEAVKTMPHVEVFILVRELPQESRFMGQMQGYERPGWGDTQWLLLNIRDLVVSALKDAKTPFPEFPLMPPAGKRSAKPKVSKVDSMLTNLRAAAKTSKR